jgi:hypothetical protein
MASVALGLSSSTQNDNSLNSTVDVCFDIGTLVNVESRTWPGINKPGGVGRVTAVDVNDSTVDVKYVLGGEEKDIEIEFVKVHTFESADDGKGRTRRRRSSDNDNSSLNIQKKPRKRALKNTSNNANKMEAEKEQSSKRKIGTKRKAQTLKDGGVSKKNKKTTLGAKDQVSKKVKSDKKSRTSKRSEKKEMFDTQPKTDNAKKSSSKETKARNKALSAIPMPTIKSSAPTKTKKQHSQPKVIPVSSRNKKRVKHKSSIVPEQRVLHTPTSSPISSTSNSRSTSTDSPVEKGKEWLKGVYNDMTNRATSFVQEMVGGKSESSTPSSPESTSSLEIEMEKG